MAYPSFYDPARAGDLYTPDVVAATAAGHSLNFPPAAADITRTLLLLIDVQVDFAHPDGALFVPGAPEDTRRTVEWIYDNLGGITQIAASLDSHTPIQIFSPTWWQDRNGEPPNPYTVVTAEEVAAGDWTPLYDVAWSRQYVRKLETDAKKQLMIWPFHTLIGTPGHNLMPSLYEAITYHGAARQSNPQMVTKGTIAKSEYYSMLEPEVKIPDHPLGSVNKAFLDDLATYDRVFITGQAKSHCVLETTTSIMRYFEGQSEIIKRLHLIADGTSAVQHPEIDFDALADAQYTAYQKQGMQIITVGG
jgi:nicotinamidase/pyrazinamidase